MLKFPSQRCFVWTFSILLSATAAFGEKNDWAEGTPGRSTGASRDYYNAAGRLPWNNFMGDWHDAKDVAQGNRAYAMANVADDDQGKFVEWDVTSLVREWQDGKHPNQGFFLRTLAQGGTIVFCSREHAEAEHRPCLIVVGERGSKDLAPQADTYLTKSTYRSQGNSDSLRISGGPDNVLIRFDLAPAKELGQVSKATLRLYTNKQYGAAEIGVFRSKQGHDLPPSEPILGLASQYPGDKGIAEDPDVVFATDFESEKWNEEWTYAGKMEVIDTVAEDAERKFEPLKDKALRVKIAKGSTGALNTLYKFKKETGKEPDEIYFRYYVRLGETWNQTLQGGKMPGISGTYGVAGWGGRKVDGTDGWSARGSFDLSIPTDNPLGGLHPIGTYCYHADMQGWYGDGWGWQNDYRGFLESNRWYSIEQYLKMNTPGEKDGILRAWVDGRLAFEKTDIRFRHVDKLKIEQIWMNVYHGGTKPSPYDQHLFIDNVVIAKKYIGPMKRE
ncbi:MAG: DNRLRE domain-containing protein [Planctomycetes bacterium]|nr:DNRLRE domain-containing protein [Planctomycetota bacterium]MBL7039219.1 DNRLRE domain-containing protein [Pirellulaceae bacterium]